MITAKFYKNETDFIGFVVTGHAGRENEQGFDIVCAAVSSAVMLAMNTVTDFLPRKFFRRRNSVKLIVKENKAGLLISGRVTPGQAAVIASLKAHMEIIARKNPGSIRIIELEK